MVIGDRQISVHDNSVVLNLFVPKTEEYLLNVIINIHGGVILDYTKSFNYNILV